MIWIKFLLGMERQSKKTKNVFCLQASKKRGKTMQNMSMIFISETNHISS